METVEQIREAVEKLKRAVEEKASAYEQAKAEYAAALEILAPRKKRKPRSKNAPVAVGAHERNAPRAVSRATERSEAGGARFPE